MKKQILQLKQTLNQSTVNAKQIESAIKDKQTELINVFIYYYCYFNTDLVKWRNRGN